MASGDADATPAAGWFSGPAPAGPGITPKARASRPQASGHDPGTQRIAPPPACLEIAPLRRRWWITGPREPVQPIRRAGPPCGRDMSAVAPIRVLKWPSDGDEGAGMACGNGFVSLSAGRLRAKLPSVPGASRVSAGRQTARDQGSASGPAPCVPKAGPRPGTTDPGGFCAWGSGGRLRPASSPEKRGVEDVPSRAGRLSPTSSTPLLF